MNGTLMLVLSEDVTNEIVSDKKNAEGNPTYRMRILNGDGRLTIGGAELRVRGFNLPVFRSRERADKLYDEVGKLMADTQVKLDVEITWRQGANGRGNMSYAVSSLEVVGVYTLPF